MQHELYFKKMKTSEEIKHFWQVKKRYEERDIFPFLDEEGEERTEIIRWFQSDEYYDIIMNSHQNPPKNGSGLQFCFV